MALVLLENGLGLDLELFTDGKGLRARRPPAHAPPGRRAGCGEESARRVRSAPVWPARARMALRASVRLGANPEPPNGVARTYKEYERRD